MSLAIFSLTFIQSFAPVLTTIALQQVINSLIKQRNDITFQFFGIYAVALIVSRIVSSCSSYFLNIFSIKNAKHINQMILATSIKLKLKNFENSETYDTLKRAINETDKAAGVLSVLIGVFSASITFGSYTSILLSWKVSVLPIILLMPIISLIFTTKLGKYEFKVIQQRTTEIRRVSYFQQLINSAASFKDNKILNIIPYLKKCYLDKYDEFIIKDISIAKMQVLGGLFLKIIEAIICSFVVFLIINSAVIGNVEIGDVYILVSAVWGITAGADTIALKMAQATKNNLFLENLFNFLDMQTFNESIKIEKKVIADVVSLEFKNVSFRYKDDLPFIFENLNFTIHKNEKILLIGENGSGKSTLIKLLCGFYSDFEGQILINDIPISLIDITSYHQALGVLFQDFVKYEFTILETLNLGNNKKIKSILEYRNSSNYNLPSYINRLPHELDTQLGHLFDGGIQLSGGERQQLALSKTFLRSASMFILDEPFAHIDIGVQSSTLEFFKSEMQEKICIIITHRIKDIDEWPDRIFSIKNKRVEETTCAKL